MSDITVIARVDHPQTGPCHVERNTKTRKYFVVHDRTGKRIAAKASEVEDIIANWLEHGGERLT
jgi:hypothetical protein